MGSIMCCASSEEDHIKANLQRPNAEYDSIATWNNETACSTTLAVPDSSTHNNSHTPREYAKPSDNCDRLPSIEQSPQKKVGGNQSTAGRTECKSRNVDEPDVRSDDVNAARSRGIVARDDTLTSVTGQMTFQSSFGDDAATLCDEADADNDADVSLRADNFELTITDDVDATMATDDDDDADSGMNFTVSKNYAQQGEDDGDDDERRLDDISDYSPTYPTFGNQTEYMPGFHSYCYAHAYHDRAASPHLAVEWRHQAQSDTQLARRCRDGEREEAGAGGRHMHRTREVERLPALPDDISPYEAEEGERSIAAAVAADAARACQRASES
ncbi:PREDICTED: uncharacterized protein LOC106809303 isoform X2 [Priapulus caudatus]|uniref:Uncharacterized protein LOC106809303 isoform X2 n=1 Tax=Priapulus caudatus TaxID=37621 RepID=A0ABM1E6K9_PRICU|nr:PREDICTED: uncharacterized protein LOC106809303 isoform X2 [Priapulus caudatus]